MKKFTLFAFTLALCISAQAQRSVSVKVAEPALRKFQKVMNAPKKVEGTFTAVKESFETADNGWTIIDAASKMSSGSVFVGSDQTTPSPAAQDGSKYLTSGFDSAASRNAWAISPASNLTAGTTYYISVYVYGQGYGGVNDEFTVTTGKGATAADQTTILIDGRADKSASYSEWTKVNASFTPTETGAYNFGLHHCTMAKDVNGFAFDLFEVTNSMEAATVENMICNGGLWDMGTTEKDVLIDENTNLYLAATATNASSLEWTIPSGTTIASGQGTTSLVANHIPMGVEDFTLTAQNPNGNVSASTTINTVNYTTGTTYYPSNVSDDESKYFVTLGTNEYQFGSNHYYNQCAELYDLPSDVKATVVAFLFSGKTAGVDDAEVKVTINAKEGETVGAVIKEFTTTASAFFAHEEGKLSQFTFPEAVSVTGPFFIQITFPTIAAGDYTNKHAGITTTYQRPTAYSSSYFYYNNSWVESTAILSPMSAGIIPVLQVSSTEGINDLVNEKEVLNTQIFNLSGMPVQKLTEKGIYVKRITYTDGTVKAVKCIK